MILIILGGYLCSDTFFLLTKSSKASSFNDFVPIESFPKSNNSKYEVSTSSYDFYKNNYEFLNQFKNDLEESKTRFFGILGTSEEISYQIEALDIESDSQSQEGDIFTAEGNVKMKLKNSLLKADKIKYDKTKKTFFAEGNIIFYRGNQYLEASKFLYNLESKNGFVDDVYGVMDVANFNKDFDLKNDDFEKNKNNVENPILIDKSSIGWAI